MIRLTRPIKNYNTNLTARVDRKFRDRDKIDARAAESNVTYKHLPRTSAINHITNYSIQRYTEEKARRYRCALLSRQNFCYFGKTEEIDPVGFYTTQALDKLLSDNESLQRELVENSDFEKYLNQKVMESMNSFGKIDSVYEQMEPGYDLRNNFERENGDFILEKFRDKLYGLML